MEVIIYYSSRVTTGRQLGVGRFFPYIYCISNAIIAQMFDNALKIH